MKKHIVIHPFLFAAFPVVSLFAHNIGQTYAREIIAPIAVTMGFALASWGLLSLLLKDKDKAGLVVSLFLLLVFSYGHLAALMKDVQIVLGGSVLVLGRYQVLLFTWGILSVVLLLFLHFERSAAVTGDAETVVRGVVFGSNEILLVMWGVTFAILLLPFLCGYSTGLTRNLVVVVGGSAIGPHDILLITCGGMFTVGTCLCIKTHRNLHRLTSILNVAAASVVVVSLLSIGSYVLRSGADWQDHEKPADRDSYAADSGQTGVLRDVYYIIFDRYASASTLEEFYNFDNSDFISYLKSKGFYIASESRCNYLKTDHSLASSLNMEYINYLSKQVGEDSADWKPIQQLIEYCEVWRFLKTKGYKFVHFGAGWGPTVKNRHADVSFNLYSCGLSSEFLAELYKTTPFYPIGIELGICDYRRAQWERVQYQFDQLSEIPRMPEPTFTFAHVLIPHDPYVFGRDGSYLTERDCESRTRRDNYLGQLIFVNNKAREVIECLLTRSEVAPIIILQADEGPNPPRYVDQEGSFDWNKASEAELTQKMGILNAYYLPDADNGVLYPSITPVNSFRLILNLYFDTDLELLPDKVYAHQDWAHPYRFSDVTEMGKHN